MTFDRSQSSAFLDPTSLVFSIIGTIGEADI